MMRINVADQSHLSRGRLSLSDSFGSSLCDLLTRSSAAGMITLYQRYISPHKGFRCAHRVYHGGQSCSGYAKTAVQQHGLGAAIPLIRQRFADCGQAARMMRSEGSSLAAVSNLSHANPQRRERRADCCADSACDCSTSSCPSPDVSDCSLFDGCERWLDDPGDCDSCGDVNGCDLGGCDVGGCDGCDFGADGCGEAMGDCGAEMAGEACTGCVPTILLPRWIQLK